MCATLAVSCIGLTGCNFSLTPTSVSRAEQEMASSKAAQITTPVIHTKGYLTVGVNVSDATVPMLIRTDKGKIQGLDVDLASAIADHLGLKVKFIPVTSDEDAAAEADIVMDVKSGDEGDLTVVGHYAESAIALFHKGKPGVATLDQLEGKSVGVQMDSVSQSMLSQSNLVMNEKGFKNLNEAFEALNAGSVDYVLCDAYSGAYLAAGFNNLSMFGTINVPQALGIGVASSNTALQQAVQKAMDELGNNGVLALIKARWLGSAKELSADSQIQGITVKEKKDEQPADGDQHQTPDDGTTVKTSAEGGDVAANAGSNAASV